LTIEFEELWQRLPASGSRPLFASLGPQFRLAPVGAAAFARLLHLNSL
jgi:hypothetical protein